jgi:outer membrane lipoprotein-sorting protein
MKLTLSTIALIGIFAIQPGKVNAIPPQHSQQITSHGPLIISQATEQLDVSLLIKAFTGFLQSDRYQTESEIKFKVGTKGAEIGLELKTNTLSQSGNKFRSEITFSDSKGGSKLANLVVSDGKQVWIYRADLKQYAVTSYRDFHNSGQWVLVSIGAVSFLGLPEAQRKVIAEGNLLDKDALEFLGLASKGLIKGDRRTVDGESFYVYNYKDPKEGFILSGFVEPETANLKQIKVVCKSNDLDIQYTEKILTRTANPVISADTFTFSPPPGTKKVKSLSIIPF